MVARLLLTVPLLAAFAYAGPCKPKSTCAPASCLAVLTTPAATADCSSFLGKTVTPCPVTSTATNTVTVTAAVTTVTATATAAAVTQYATVQTALTSIVTTIHQTATVVQTTEVDVLQTVATIVTPSAVLGRREAASTCAPTTASDATIPRYASACLDKAIYSSACSCVGVTGSTTTLTAVTTVVSITKTSTVKPTSTVTNTLAITVAATTVETQIVPATIVTTDATIVVPKTLTVVQTTIVTNTAPTPTICPSYQFIAQNGSYAGKYLQGGRNVVSFTSDTTQPIVHALHRDGRVSSQGINWSSTLGENSLVYLRGDRSGLTYNICKIQPGTTKAAGAIGILSCSVSDQEIIYFSNPAIYPNEVLDTYKANPKAGSAGEFITLDAVPQGFVNC